MLLLAIFPGHGCYVWHHAGMRPFEQVSRQPERLIARMLATGLIDGGAVLFAFSAARAWMRRRWIWAVVATLLAYPLIVVATALTTSTPRASLPALP